MMLYSRVNVLRIAGSIPTGDFLTMIFSGLLPLSLLQSVMPLPRYVLTPCALAGLSAIAERRLQKRRSSVGAPAESGDLLQGIKIQPYYVFMSCLSYSGCRPTTPRRFPSALSSDPPCVSRSGLLSQTWNASSMKHLARHACSGFHRTTDPTQAGPAHGSTPLGVTQMTRHATVKGQSRMTGLQNRQGVRCIFLNDRAQAGHLHITRATFAWTFEIPLFHCRSRPVERDGVVCGSR